MALRNAFGTEAAANYLNELLSRSPYEDLWKLEVKKQNDGINQAAVVRVLAGYLTLWGRVHPDFNPRSLKDPVNRALTGKNGIAAETFELFVAAFGFSPSQIEDWWARRQEDGVRLRDAAESFHKKWPPIPLPYQTTSVSETHHVNPSELTCRRHGLQAIRAVDEVSRVQLRILDSIEPSVSTDGAEVIEVRRMLDQHYLATLALPRTLKPGVSTIFEYEIRSKQTPDPQHFRRLFINDETNVKLAVRFDPATFQQPVSFNSWTDIGTHRTEFCETLATDRKGLVQKSLEGVVGGMVLGFTWNRPQ